jgi:hypothetical protein
VESREAVVRSDVRVIERALRSEFQSLAFAKSDFPMLTDWGVEDFSVTIHSLGCSYFSALGRKAGCWATSEYPVRVSTGVTGYSIRPDVAWWIRPTPAVVLLGEFERFESGERNLIGKARNLLRAHHELGEQPRVLLLVAWTIAGTDLRGLDEVRAVSHDGFRTSDGLVVPGLGSESKFVLATAVFGGPDGRRRLQVVTT